MQKAGFLTTRLKCEIFNVRINIHITMMRFVCKRARYLPSTQAHSFMENFTSSADTKRESYQSLTKELTLNTGKVAP